MKRPKLLVLDDYEGELAAAPAMNKIRELADVTILDRPLTPVDMLDLKNFQVLLALRERTQMDEQFFEACTNLELVLQTGGHAYHVDKAAATQRGIIVALGRGATRPTIVIPELTFGFILSLIRQIHPLTNQMANGEWSQVIGGSLRDRTLGIVGYGRHGRPIGRIARSFGMKIVAWGRGSSYPDDEPDVQRLSLDELFAVSDIVTIHLRLSDESRGLITRNHLAKMKPTAFLINTARGAIINEGDLIEALREEWIAGAALDVFTTEPLPASSPLRTLPNVLLTPHIGWQVSDVLHEFCVISAGQMEAWLNGQLPRAQVLNPEAMTANQA